MLDIGQVETFLTTVGDRVSSPKVITLLGGSALGLLGNHRPTLDIDYDGEENATDEFSLLLKRVAAELDVDLEAVPLHRFIPLPAGAEKRHIPVGMFGNLQVYVFDPYSITLSKLDRGFESDIEDVIFLLHHHYVNGEEIEMMIGKASSVAAKYDLNPNQMRANLEMAHRLLANM